MRIVMHHLKSLLIAVVALAMSAGLTLGAAAPQSSFGHVRAASHAGTTAGSGDEVTAGEDEETEADEDTDEGEDDEDTDEGEDVEDTEDAEGTEEDGDGGENCATDPTDPATDVTVLTHGQIVCWAAHQETPEGYANHGAWVSEWAKGDHGNAEAAKQKSKGKGKGHNKPE